METELFDNFLDDKYEPEVEECFNPVLLFHVDTRDFVEGNVINADGTTYEIKLKGEKQEMEEMLNKVNPFRDRRSNHVFLFDEFRNALRYACKCGGNIYVVSTDSVEHKADMNKLDNILDIFRYTECKEIREAAAQEYWKRGTHTFAPCYELLAKTCLVEKKVMDKDEVTSFRAKYILNTRPVEQCLEYREWLSRIYD